MPLHLTWSTNNYPVNTTNYGGPARFNSLQKVPAQRVRLIQDMSRECFINSCGSNINNAILMQECRVNEMDYLEARDFGICYQIVCLCIRPYTDAPFTSTGNNRLADLRNYWQADPGWSGDHVQNANAWFDMAQGTMNLGGGVAYAPGCFCITDPDYNGNVQGHETAHNWGAGDVTSQWDYTGENRWHWEETGSGYGHATEMVHRALGIRRSGEYYKSAYNMEWVKYNSPVAPWATPDFAATTTNRAVALNVLLNDYCINSNAVSVVSFETNTPAGGWVTNLGNGMLQYTPPPNFTGYDWFHYYVGEGTGLKSLSEVHVRVSDPANPVLAQWDFDQTNGTTLLETTGRGVAGTLQGTASFAAGAADGINNTGALHLDGSGYVQFPGRWFDPLNGNWTLSLWCRPDATPSSDQVLFSKTDRSGANGLYLALNGSSFYLKGATFGIASGFSVNASLVPQAGRWHHIVAQIDRTNNLARLWVNGVEYTGTSNTRSVPAAEFIFGEAPPALGACPGRGNNFIGSLDEVRLYSKALTQAEINSLYTAGGILPAALSAPLDGERNVAIQPMMKWTAGRPNYQHDVYLGTSELAVLIATTNSAEYQGRLAAAEYMPPGALLTNTTYYWRVDEVENGTNYAPSEVWSFTVAADAVHGGLKLYLSLDNRDTVGTSTYDRSAPPFHDGVLYNSPVQTGGEVYEAFNFNGTSSYVETPALNLYTARATLLAWVKRSGSLSSYAGIVFCRGTTAAGLDVRGTSNQLGYHWNNDAGTYNYVSGLTLPDGQWVLAALTVETNRAIFYLGQTNGVIQTATNNYTHVVQAFDGPLAVARDSAGSRYFSGTIDEVCVWNRPLTLAEISQILTNGINGASFAGGRPVPPPGSFTWTGASDAYWTNTSNWAAAAVPGSSNTVFFNDSASGDTATQLGQDLSVASINVSGGLRGLGVGGTNILALGSGGLVLTNTSATATLSAPVRLSAAQTWKVAEGGTIAVSGTLTNGNYLLTLNNTNVINLNGVITGSGGLTHNGPGTVTLTSANSYSGANSVNGGKLISTVSCWYSPRGIGSGSLTINSGATAQFTKAHGFGSGTGGASATVNGGTLQFDAENYVNGLTMTAGSLVGNGELRTTGNVTYNFNAASASSLITLGLNLVYGGLTFSVANGAADPDLMVSGSVYGSGGNITKSGAGTLLLTRACSFAGNTAVSKGILKLSATDDVLPVGGALSVAAAGTLTLDGVNQTVASLSGDGTVNLGNGYLRDNTVSNDLFSGVITGVPVGGGFSDSQQGPSGGLAKDGTGKLTLSSQQPYSGDTWVLAGMLALTGSGALPASSNILLYSGTTLDVTARSGGSLNLNPGQTLRGYGSVLGQVAVASGASVAPGDTVPGTLTTGAETWYGGGTYAWDITDPVNSSGRDLLNISGTLTVQATPANKFVIRLVSLSPDFTPGLLSGFNNQSNYQWTIATATGGLLNFNPAAFTIDATGFGNPLAGGTFSLSQAGNALALNFRPYPPPAPLITGNTLLPGGGFALSGTGIANQVWIFSAASNLIAPVTWTPLTTNAADGNGFFQFLDGQATNYPQRFYRLLAP